MKKIIIEIIINWYAEDGPHNMRGPDTVGYNRGPEILGRLTSESKIERLERDIQKAVKHHGTLGLR